MEQIDGLGKLVLFRKLAGLLERRLRCCRVLGGGALVFLPFDFKALERPPRSGACGVILLGALQFPARVVVIGDATVGFSQAELPSFVARIETQRFVVGGNGAGEILCGSECVAG